MKLEGSGAYEPEKDPRNITKQGILVKAGQIWRDLDHRQDGRTVEVLYCHSGTAVVKGARRSELSIRRMHDHSTGWMLVR